MPEEQQVQEGERSEAKSSLSKLLLGKIVSHKIFSEQVLYWLLLGVAFLMPIFFIPGQIVAPEFAKMVLLEIIVLFSVFAWSLGRLRDGHISVPKSMLLLVSALLVVQFVVAAVVSPAPLVSFFGSGYDMGTVSVFIVLFLLMFLSSIVFSDRDRLLSLYASFLLSGSIVMLYQVLRHIFGVEFLDFGLFSSAVSTPVGKWNDFAALAGGMMLLVIVTLHFFPSNKMLRIPAYVIFALGLFFLLVIDFTVLWIILCVLTAAIITLGIIEGESSHSRAVREAAQSGTDHPHKPIHRRIPGHLPVLAVVLLVVSVIYASGLSVTQWGSEKYSIASVVSKTFHSSPYSEVVLTPRSTYEIVKGTLGDSPLFGTGPNRFGSGFLLHKTSEMNRTPFWDTAFEFGLGRIPTYFGTTGIIGMILWLLFIGVLLMKMRHIMNLFSKDRIAAYMSFSLFLLTIYFWSLAFFYLPNIAIFSLAFVFAGALISFLVGEGVLKNFRVPFSGNPRLSVVITPIVIIVLVGVVASGVMLYRQVSSLAAFHDAQEAIIASDLDKAETAIFRANGLAERDIYRRTMSNLSLARLTQLSTTDLTAEQVQAKANQYFVDARSNAERAVDLDPSNFENYLQLGGVYDTLGSLGAAGTAEAARENYQKALLLNPKSPRVLFVLARLEYLAGDTVKSKEYLLRALAERPNYLEAVSFLVQINLQEKNPDEAILVLRSSVAAEPTNFLLRFALGYLEYSKRNYAAAITEFEAAVILNPVYSDAKYFLGLSYDRVGRSQDSIQQFTDVLTLNPDNKDVTSILTNLKAGRDPFAPPYVAPTEPVADALKDLNQGEGSQTEN